MLLVSMGCERGVLPFGDRGDERFSSVVPTKSPTRYEDPKGGWLCDGAFDRATAYDEDGRLAWTS
jgi:hypothetical protein